MQLATRLLALAGACLIAMPAMAQTNVTPERVGDPFRAHWPDDPYARNIWAMTTFGGRLYLGAGNSANSGPSANAGPVPVISFDGRNFIEEIVLPEEQVDIFYTDNDRLVIPGHDPKEPWAFGNYYTLHDGKWEKSRNVPHGIHIYDMVQFNGHFVAAGGAFDQPIDGWVSTDDGKSWQPAELLPNPDFATPDNPRGEFRRLWAGGVGGRLYSLIPIGDKLYASGSAPLLPGGDGAAVYRASLFEYDPAERGFRPIRLETENIHPVAKVKYARKNADFFPGTRLRGANPPVARRVTILGDRTFYLGTWTRNDHQWEPFGLFVQSGEDDTQRINLPQGVRIWDLKTHGEHLYLLADQLAENGQHIISVLRLDSDRTTPMLQFNAPAFARSFTFHGDYLYFGMGVQEDDISEQDTNAMSGQIIRTRWPVSPAGSE